MIDERLAVAFDAVDVSGVKTWVGVAGTLTTIAALNLDLPEYDSEAIHLSRHGLDDVARVCDQLVGETRAQRLAHGPMHPGRVDVIGGGSLVTASLAREFAKRADITEMVVSEHDILDGIALGVAEA